MKAVNENKTKNEIYNRFSKLKKELKEYDPQICGWTIYYDIQNEGQKLWNILQQKGLTKTDKYQFYLFQKQLNKTEKMIENKVTN